MIGLSNNKIGFWGAEALGESLSDKLHVLKIGLEANGIGADGVWCLAMALERN